MANPLKTVAAESKKLPVYVVMGIGIAAGALIFGAVWAFVRAKTAKKTATNTAAAPNA